MSKPDKSPKKPPRPPGADELALLNNSGYPFQEAVERVMRDSNSELSILSEMPWRHDSGESGYIDLVVTQHALRYVMECKRVTGGGRWVFFSTPKDRQPRSGRGPDSTPATVMWRRFHEERPLGCWQEFPTVPPSPVAGYAVVRGQSEEHVSQLERLANKVVLCSETLWQTEDMNNLDPLRFYVPVLVTNATLTVIEGDPADIDITTGELAHTSRTRIDVDVPFLRFSKSLAIPGSSIRHARVPGHSTPLQRLHRTSRRTVFVVNSSHVAAFVAKFDISQQSYEALISMSDGLMM